jgi:uncharacterized protein YecE (DUF72 family)
MSLTSYQAAPPRAVKFTMFDRPSKRNQKHLFCREIEKTRRFHHSDRMAAKILVGTASWSDPGFVEFWYPRKMRPTDRLGWYAQYFNMVEINSTFYSVPDPMLVRRWCDATPSTFVFNVKLHQLLSYHSTSAKLLPPALQKKLRLEKNAKVPLTKETSAEMLRAFAPSLEVFHRAGKLGILLLQLSPAFSPRKHDLADLKDVLALVRDYRVAIELRNRNWAEGEQLQQTLDFMGKQDAIFVNVDAPAEKHFTIMPSDLNNITNKEAAYLRLHGRDSRAYIRGKTVAARFNYDYSDAEIEEIAARTEDLATKAKEVHVIFNNNARDYAPHAALRLRKALGQLVSPPPQTAELF